MSVRYSNKLHHFAPTPKISVGCGPVSVTSVSYLPGQNSIVAARYGSIVVAISMVTATCILKVV